MTYFAGWQKHLRWAKETVWGQAPGSPQWIALPYAQYNVGVQTQQVVADVFTGLRQPRHHRSIHAVVSGRLALPLFSHHLEGASIAEHLLSALVSSPASIDLASFTSELYEADTDNKRHLGLRCDRGLLRGDAETGLVDLTLDVVGQSELGGVALAAPDPTLPLPIEFPFKDYSMTLEAQAVEVRRFALELANNLQVHHNNSYWPSLVTAGTRGVTFEFTVLKTDDAYDVMRRVPPPQFSVQVQLLGNHGGTGPGGTNATRLTVDLPRLAPVEITDGGELDDLQRQTIRCVALKPDGAANEVDFTFDAV